MPELLKAFLPVLKPVLLAIVPTALTLLVGSFWINRLFVARGNFATLIDRVCNSLDALMDDCAQYWSVDYSVADESKLELLEAKIKGRMIQISMLIELIYEKRKHLTGALRGHLADLADACTGGLFESKTRKKEKGRHMKIVRISYTIAVELMRQKIWTSRLGEFIDEVCTRPFSIPKDHRDVI